MKPTLIITAMIFAIGSSTAFAQAPALDTAPTAQVQTHTGNPHKAATRIGRQLGLTPDQTAKLEPILADRKQKIEALRENTSLTDAQRKQQLKTIHQTARMQLGGVLTPDQMKQMKAMQHRHKTGTEKSSANV